MILAGLVRAPAGLANVTLYVYYLRLLIGMEGAATHRILRLEVKVQWTCTTNLAPSHSKIHYHIDRNSIHYTITFTYLLPRPYPYRLTPSFTICSIFSASCLPIAA